MTRVASQVHPGGRASLRTRVLRAGGWSLAGFVVSQGVRFGSNLVMTRLLVPEMWGVTSIALMIMMGLGLFSDIGLRQSVIQSARGTEKSFLDTVWTTKIGISAGMMTCAFIIAAGLTLANATGLFPVGSTYASPDLPQVVAALGLCALIGGFESTKSMEAGRNLSLARWTQIGLISQFASVVTMLSLAMFTRTIWVLVGGSVASAIATTVLSHAWLPGVRNSFTWDRDNFREILRFGRWVLGSSAITFLAMSMDKLILGALISATLLGVYSIAGLLYSAVDQVLMKLISDLSFPALSEVARERKHELRNTLYKFHRVVIPGANLVLGMLLVCGPFIVRILYDKRYEDAGWMLQIVSLNLLAMPARLHATCLLALGQSRIMFFQAVASLTGTLVGVLGGYHLFGVGGAIAGIVVGNLLGATIPVFFSAKESLVDFRRELAMLLVIPLGAGLGWAAVSLAGR